MRSTRRVFIAAVTAVGLVAASCGSDDKDSSSTAAATTAAAATTVASTTASTDAGAETTVAGTDTTTGETDASTATSTDETTESSTGASTDETTDSSGAPEYTLDAPVVIDSLISDPGGTDQNAVADFNNGARLAIDEINAAGGIGGQQIEFKAIETPPTGDAVVNSLNLALEDKPTALLGPASSTALLAITDKVDAAGIPMINTTVEPKAVHDGEAGSQWIFANRPSNDGAAEVAARYAIEELGAKKIGLMYTNTSFGTSGAAAQKAAIEAGGAEVSADESFEFNATDLTNTALAMDGSDAILDWGTPGTVGLAVNTLAQQGLSDIPHIGPGSIGFGFFSAIVGDASLLDGVLGVLDCNPIGDDRAEAKTFVDAYTAAYDTPPSYAAAEMYDTVYILKYVIDQAGKADPESIRAGLESLKGYTGVCSDSYENINGVLSHSVVVAKFVDGALETQKVYAVG